MGYKFVCKYTWKRITIVGIENIPPAGPYYSLISFNKEFNTRPEALDFLNSHIEELRCYTLVLCEIFKSEKVEDD